MTHYEKCHIDGDTTIHDELLYIGQTTCGEIEIPLRGRDIKAICTTGENDLAVEAVADSPRIRMWMERYGDETIQRVLTECGCGQRKSFLSDGQTSIDWCGFLHGMFSTARIPVNTWQQMPFKTCFYRID